MMLKTILTDILIIVFLIESAGLAYLDPQPETQDSALRPMASAIVKDINKILSAKTESLLQEESDNPYHPRNILATFKKGKLPWLEIPKEYFTPDIEILVKELVRLRKKDPYELNTIDFKDFVFAMPSGKKKSLYGLLGFIIDNYAPETNKEAIRWIKKRLRIKKYLNPKYHPDNILATFKKGALSWESIPEEYLIRDIEVFVKELARLVEKECYELGIRDFQDPVFLRFSKGKKKKKKKKLLHGLLIFIIRKYDLSNATEALSKIKELLGIRESLWGSNDWKEVRKSFEPTMKYELWKQIETERDLDTYLYFHGVTREQEVILAGLIEKGEGNKAALSALIYSHHRYIQNYVDWASRKYRLDPAGLMEYITRRLETASLSFDPKQAKYATFIRGPMRSARYDYMRVIKGTRRKAKVSQFPQSQDKEAEQFEANIPDREKQVLFDPENKLIIDRVLKALGVSGRNRRIFIMVRCYRMLQKDVADKLELDNTRISQIMKDINAIFAPYKEMTEIVTKGDMLLGPLLEQIKADRARGLRLNVDKKVLKALATQA